MTCMVQSLRTSRQNVRVSASVSPQLLVMVEISKFQSVDHKNLSVSQTDESSADLSRLRGVGDPVQVCKAGQKSTPDV